MKDLPVSDTAYFGILFYIENKEQDWHTAENPQVLQVLKSSEALCSEYWRKVDIAAGKPLCKFTLITASTKVGGAVIGPKSQKGLLHMLGWHSRDSAAEPLVWVRAWEGCQKPHWKFGINIILIFRTIPHIRGRSTPQDNTVLHQQQLD